MRSNLLYLRGSAVGLALTRHEVIRNLRKWAFFIAAGIAVIGCGGGGNNSGSSSTGTSTTGGLTNQLSPNLSATFGTIDFTYLTGQLRAPGDLTAVVSRVEVEDASGVVRSILETPRRLPLASYVTSTISLNVPFTGQSNRTFERTDLDFLEFFQEDTVSGGTPTFTRVDVASPSPFPYSVPTRIRVLPGRNVTVPILLDDAMFGISGTGTVTFDKSRFDLRNNITGTGGYIQTFFSDYVAFDISSMPASLRPSLSTGEKADKLFVSGDNYALGAVTATGRTFEVLTLDSSAPIIGTYGLESSVGGRTTPGTYTLRQLDPRQLDDSVKVTITSLQGIWRDSSRAFSNNGSSDFILFPTSRNEPPNGLNGAGLKPDVNQEIALVVRDATGNVVDFYYGTADLDQKTFTAYSLKGITTADASNEIRGTLSGYLNGNASPTSTFDLVRTGSYTFTANKPASFPDTGTFVMYRK